MHEKLSIVRKEVNHSVSDGSYPFWEKDSVSVVLLNNLSPFGRKH
jgi:hypothetical protein